MSSILLATVVVFAAVVGVVSSLIMTTPGRRRRLPQQQQQHPAWDPYHRSVPTNARTRTPPGGGVLSSTISSSGSSSSSSSSSSKKTKTKTKIKTKTNRTKPELQEEYDVIIVGSGVGGLSAGAMLSYYGYTVALLEAHAVPGGAAHGFTLQAAEGTFHFDTGPSFFSGLNPQIAPKDSNPLRTILDTLEEPVACHPYTTFGLKFPEGDFLHTPQFGSTRATNLDGTVGIAAWSQLMTNMVPLAAVVDAIPTAALRGDGLAVAVTAGPYVKNLAAPKGKLSNPWENLKLTQPFQTMLTAANITPATTPFTQHWCDLLCFCLSGLPADGTITAEMALMLGEFYDDDAQMDCPIGGAKAIVEALVRGIEKHGGHIFVNTPVEEILTQPTTKTSLFPFRSRRTTRATGVKLRRRTNTKTKTSATKNSSRIITAKHAVVSNVSVWDLFGSPTSGRKGLVDPSVFPPEFIQEKTATPVGKSFMHLHLGFRMTQQEMEQFKLQAHYMYIDDWNKGVDGEDNAVLVSIPSVHDDTLAPPGGYAVLHAYTPATEDYARWSQVQRNSDDYQQLKHERSQYLWTVVEKIIPDIRDRIVVSKIGTPLTHQRFLNRYRGSYGPAIQAGVGSFPFPKTPVDGLLVCGDSCFPGIGIPAVAGSGFLTANSVSWDSIQPQLKLLQSLRDQKQKRQ